MKLKAAGLPIHEFPQSTANTMKMGTGLFDLIKGKNLLPYPDEELREQALNCVAVETAQGFRLAKERASKQIDAIVALSMACVAALDQPLAVPFDLLSNGQWISGRSVEPRQPAQPSDADSVCPRACSLTSSASAAPG